MQGVTVLGLESSCDDSAAGIVRLGDDGVQVLANVVLGQDDLHALYGGVVPEIAARAHAERMDVVTHKALQAAGLSFADLHAIAATAGPGLIGGLSAAVMAAKGMALACGVPFIAVNHLEAHALSPRLAYDVAFPYLLLLTSGGHCQLLLARDIGRYQLLGSTIDDAAGECFDKCAKAMGLGFPGGPQIERLAQTGDASRYALPEPLAGRAGCDFSFSGLKTAMVRHIQSADLTDGQQRADLAAALQAAVAQHLCSRTARALQDHVHAITALVVAGGVAANQHVRARLQQLADAHARPLVAPPLAYCTDNGAMVALAGAEHLRRGQVSALDTPVRPRWPLDSLSALTAPRLGAGRKGAKA